MHGGLLDAAMSHQPANDSSAAMPSNRGAQKETGPARKSGASPVVMAAIGRHDGIS
jgi:hypothetical protein